MKNQLKILLLSSLCAVSVSSYGMYDANIRSFSEKQLNAMPLLPAVPRTRFAEPVRVRHQAHLNAEIPSNLETISNISALMSGYDEDVDTYPNMIINGSVIRNTLRDHEQIMRKQLGEENAWLKAAASLKQDQCDSYAQKLVIPTGSQVVFFGDLHGCVHSLLRNLERLKKETVIDDQFKIIAPNTYMIFLGDFVDRGKYGVEVIYTLMQLKINNPDHVFLVRGNHEHRVMNASNSSGGFMTELARKYGGNHTLYEMIYDMYELLPAVLYLGFEQDGVTRYFQCCHGGMEMGFNPKELFASAMKYQKIDIKVLQENRVAACKCIHEDELRSGVETIVGSMGIHQLFTGPSLLNLGFLWNDFATQDPNELERYASGRAYNPNRGLKCGEKLTREILNQASSDTHRVIGVMRAHQSAGDMFEGWTDQQTGVHHDGLCKKGLVGLWKNEHSLANGNLVYTTFSAPIYPGFDLDSYVMLIITHSGFWMPAPAAQKIASGTFR